MTAIALPALPDLAQVRPRLIDNSAMLVPILGGAQQLIARLGSRFALDVQLPPLEPVDARGFIAARLRSKTEARTLTIAWPQPLGTALGTPTVNGAGQLGASLAVHGLPASVTIPALTPFSFTAGGRSYLHLTTSDVTASGGGGATLPIAPMLRKSPADATALIFAAPVLEGFLEGNTVEWSLERLRWASSSFTLAENE
jgi:hypothetical protein